MPSNAPETQALLPVTQADRAAAWPFVPENSIAGTNREGFFNGGYDGAAIIQAFARHRISHSLPGDEAAQVKAVMSILWKREQYNGVGPDYDNYRPGSKFDMGGRVERYEKEARDIIAALAALTPSALSGDAGEGERLRAEVEGYRKLTRDQQSRIGKLEGALMARPPINPSDGSWWYPEGDTSSDACCHGPTEALEGPADEMDEGESRVVVLERALSLPDVYAALHVFTEAEKDARDDDDPWDFTLHTTPDEARAALNADRPQDKGEASRG